MQRVSQAFLAVRMRGREKYMKDICEKRQSLNCYVIQSILVLQSNCVLYFLPKKKKHRQSFS